MNTPSNLRAIAPALFLVRCTECSRQVSPKEVAKIGGGAVRCWQCHERYLKNLSAICHQAPPKNCAGCNTPFMELPDDGHGNVSMYLHLKDNILQMLCGACDRRYIQQRADLYRSTEFGWTEKL